MDGKGWTLKNAGTGKYLRDASPATYDEPTYFTFCTLTDATTGISDLYEPANGSSHFADAVFNLQGVKMGTKAEWNSLPQGIYIVDGKLRKK